MLFFLRLPFNQLKACPRELPGFLCPRWALASRAKISVMSRGTRSPVDLLRDIAEVLGAKPPAQSMRLLTGTSYRRGSENSPSLSGVWWIPLSLFGLALCLYFSCLSPPGTTMRSAGWVRERLRWEKNEKGLQRTERTVWTEWHEKARTQSTTENILKEL